MAFFKKLADRLFRSSDRITEGLDAVIDAQAPGVTQSPQPNPSKAQRRQVFSTVCSRPMKGAKKAVF